MAFQKVIIQGNLGADPETRNLPNGTSVTNFNVAVGEKWKNKDGVQQEHTEWFRCSAWGKTGEVIGQYFKKGSGILVEGKMRTDEYADKNTGEKKYSVQLNVSGFSFTDSKGSAPQQQPQQSAPAAPANFDDDENIPF